MPTTTSAIPVLSTKPQWDLSLGIDAPVAKVWEVMDDLTLIPRYHPDVQHVEFISGTKQRAAGVAYKCVISDGRRAGWCIEETIEYEPFQHMTIAFPEDTWGMGKILEDFVTRLDIEPGPENSTILHVLGFYRVKGLHWHVFNTLVLRRMMRRRVRRVFDNLKRFIEDGSGGQDT